MQIESFISKNKIKKPTIFFYRSNEKYGFLSNLYKAEIEFEGKLFATSEHAYQYGKYRDKKIADWVMTAPKPHLVAIVSHGLFSWDIVKGWSKIKIQRMREVILVKFTQHQNLANLLIQTENAELVEKSKSDSFWGSGKKGNGKNWLGKILMEIRSFLINKENIEEK